VISKSLRLLIALLWPAVPLRPRGRLAAHQCFNNLKQLGLAYHTTSRPTTSSSRRTPIPPIPRPRGLLILGLYLFAFTCRFFQPGAEPIYNAIEPSTCVCRTLPTSRCRPPRATPDQRAAFAPSERRAAPSAPWATTVLGATFVVPRRSSRTQGRSVPEPGIGGSPAGRVRPADRLLARAVTEVVRRTTACSAST